MVNDILSKVWPEWRIEKQLGKGSYGVVYEAIRTDNGITSKAAIKVISIPQDASEADSLRSEGLTEDATKTYFKGIVDDFVNEIKMMESFKGIQNIVCVEDYKVVERTDEIGWDIFIRMELLTPFNTWIQGRKMTEQEVAKLGCDICTALDICAKKNIIHRDIKPENIFVNEFGFFKLGDFGIARKMENMTTGLSQKGTFNYMAPEVYTGGIYDARVDIYSLGIVLYRLMNGNRLPFLFNEAQLMDPNERKLALEKRLRGEPLPPPCEASPLMSSLILCACDFSPSKRFGSAIAMKNALASLAEGATVIPPVMPMQDNLDATVNLSDIQQNSGADAQKSGNALNEVPAQKNTFGKKKSKAPLIILIFLFFAVLGVGGYFAVTYLGDKVSELSVFNKEDKKAQDEEAKEENSESEQESPTPTKAPTPTLSPTPSPTPSPSPTPTPTPTITPTPAPGLDIAFSISDVVITERDIKNIYVTLTGEKLDEIMSSEEILITYTNNNTNIVNVSWGEWEGVMIPLIIEPLANGSTIIEVSVKGKSVSKIINVTVDITEEDNGTTQYEALEQAVSELISRYHDACIKADEDLLRQCLMNPEYINLDYAKTRYSLTEFFCDYEFIIYDGINELDYVVFAVYNEKIVLIDTPAPSMEMFYIAKDDATGELFIYSQTTSSEVDAYCEELLQKDEVKEKISQVEEALQEALLSDDDLNMFFTLLQENLSGE